MIVMVKFPLIFQFFLDVAAAGFKKVLLRFGAVLGFCLYRTVPFLYLKHEAL